MPTVYETLSAAHGREEKPTSAGARQNGGAQANGRDATGKGAKTALADVKGNSSKVKKHKVDPVRANEARWRRFRDECARDAIRSFATMTTTTTTTTDDDAIDASVRCADGRTRF